MIFSFMRYCRSKVFPSFTTAFNGYLYFSKINSKRLSSVKKLAGQTIWYGVPTIASRFIGYLLSIFLFRWYGASITADITMVYAIIPFLNILFTYGMETAYFRFTTQTDEKKLFSTLSISLLVSTFLFSAVLLMTSDKIARFADLQAHPEYVRWMVYILFFDTLSVLPFARLRHQERPKKYAFVKVMSVVLTVLFTVFFLRVMPGVYERNPDAAWVNAIYDPGVGIGYYIMSNAIASGLALLLLWQEWKSIRFNFDADLWKRVLRYAYPLIIVGMGGMINEMLSRLVYTNVLQADALEAKRQLGIFGAGYKVAVLITIFIQVFRMAAEPFFFKQSVNKDAPETYARVMKFFSLACALMWMFIVLNLDWITKLAYGQHFAEYSQGNSIIPILAMGSVFLGIYYNLSIWYKLTNKTWAGAWITIIGAAITIVLNFALIPKYGYNGSAWATFACYLVMMIISAVWGQKNYPVNYTWNRILEYLLVATAVYVISIWLFDMVKSRVIVQYLIGSILFICYGLYLLIRERKEFAAIPVIGKWIR